MQASRTEILYPSFACSIFKIKMSFSMHSFVRASFLDNKRKTLASVLFRFIFCMMKSFSVNIFSDVLFLSPIGNASSNFSLPKHLLMNMRVAFSNLFQGIALVLRLFSFLLLFFINFDFDVVLPAKSSFNLASSFSAPSLVLEVRSKIFSSKGVVVIFLLLFEAFS